MQISLNDKQEWLEEARRVLTIEANAVARQVPLLDTHFLDACEMLLATKGHVIVVGMGKSGHIGAKIAATLASTGTPAFYVHPAEAGHGDIGMITKEDTVLALSFSGENSETLAMLPAITSMNVPIISITGNAQSTLAQKSTLHVPITILKEACPLGLAPTSSSTTTLAMGDALAITIMRARDFTSEDFARSHPLGRLGRRLTVKVGDIMRQADELPINTPQDSVQTALFQITGKRLGMTLVLENHQLIGVYTDGDLRRSLAKHADALALPLGEVMTKNPATISAHTLAADALQEMQKRQITVLPVVDDDKLVGAVHIHDLLAAGIA